MNGRKVLVVNDKADMGRSYYLPFAFVGPRTDDIGLLRSDPKSIALVVFTGGADVNPELYDENVSRTTWFDSKRDEDEFAVFNEAVENKIPMFGICRGLQFLTVMFSGRLIQHTNGHHRPHTMRLKNKYQGLKEFVVTSSHHQMVLPHEDDEILAWATPRLSTTYLDGEDQEIMQPNLEVEAVKFTNAVGVQYHPEVMDKDTPGFTYVEYLIRKYLPTAVDSASPSSPKNRK